ncbi:GGDEF domain-containing protein [Patescibacteria group bacterium]|nr:GGDEF domain-containing protein [Patescibacteria group bacterium]
MHKGESGLDKIGGSGQGEQGKEVTIEGTPLAPELAESIGDVNDRIENLILEGGLDLEIKSILLLQQAKIKELMSALDHSIKENGNLMDKNNKLNSLAQELVGKYQTLDKVHKEVLKSQLHDVNLPSLYSKEVGSNFLVSAVKRAIRKENGKFVDLGLIVFDVDKFKTVNDLYGHEVGDEALRTVAEVITANIRDTDMPTRNGGDEFFVVLPDCPIEGAESVAHKLKTGIEKVRIKITDQDLYSHLREKVELFLGALQNIDSSQGNKIQLFNEQLSLIENEISEFGESESFLKCVDVMKDLLEPMVIELGDDTDAKHKTIFLEQFGVLRNALPHFANTKEDGLKISVSLGVGTLRRDELDVVLNKTEKTKQAEAVKGRFFSRVDKLAYKSKGRGRNQITSERDI